MVLAAGARLELPSLHRGRVNLDCLRGEPSRRAIVIPNPNSRSQARSHRRARITGINADDLGSELMKFFNGQFWYRRHTGGPRLATCADVEALI